MGQETVRTIEDADDLFLAGAFETDEERGAWSGEADVLVDFTQPEAAFQIAEWSMRQGIAPVVGTSGLDEDSLSRLSAISGETGTPGCWIPNFAIGAVLMMKFAAEAARWMPDVEVIEMHHDGKRDAPSGTAMRTAEILTESGADAGKPEEVTKADHARGADVGGVRVHSVRLPGLVAHQQVLFGGQGELLTLRHDSLNRLSFMEGVKLAVRKVRDQSGFVVGLDALMDG